VQEADRRAVAARFDGGVWVGAGAHGLPSLAEARTVARWLRGLGIRLRAPDEVRVRDARVFLRSVPVLARVTGRRRRRGWKVCGGRDASYRVTPPAQA
jgi:hypothetical protein